MTTISYSEYTTEIWVKVTKPNSKYPPRIQPVRGRDVKDALTRAKHLWYDVTIEQITPMNLEDPYHIDTRWIDDPIVRYHLRRTTRRYTVSRWAGGWFIMDELRKRTHSQDYDTESSAENVAYQLNKDNVKLGAENFDQPNK